MKRKFYLRDALRHPFGTVVVDRASDPRYLTVGVAVQNPCDPWDRWEGTRLATERCDAGQFKMPAPLLASLDDFTGSTMLAVMLRSIYSTRADEVFESYPADYLRNGRVFAKTCQILCTE